jgi:hypothetical protein
MDDDDVKVGQQVRLPDSEHGWVLEIDPVFQAARIELASGGEVWSRLDDLEVEPWNRSSVGAE